MVDLLVKMQLTNQRLIRKYKIIYDKILLFSKLIVSSYIKSFIFFFVSFFQFTLIVTIIFLHINVLIAVGLHYYATQHIKHIYEIIQS